jgi:multimeric flavodoxin WrbA
MRAVVILLLKVLPMQKSKPCGTCIKSRNQEGTEMCPINTMKDMYEIIKESDKVVTF